MTTAPCRPDAADGVFETTLVAGGEPVELDAHLARLGASVETLYGRRLPRGLAEEARSAARQLPLGRLRILAAPSADGVRTQFSAEEVDAAGLFPSWERGAELVSARCDGGLGPHKWADRSPLPSLAEGAVPLLLDGEAVLEAGRANVFAVLDGALVTPPADGRILPGITRARAIGAAADAGVAVIERPVSREELLDAEEVFITGSVRGIEPARLLDGVTLAIGTEVGLQLGATLRSRWLTASPASP